MIQAAPVFRYRVEKQTHRKAEVKPYPATADGVSNNETTWNEVSALSCFFSLPTLLSGPLENQL